MIDLAVSYLIPAAYAVLPVRMASAEATAMLLAIGLQESKWLHRRQIRGPARGFYQFERGGGVTGVLTHPASAPHAKAALVALCYSPKMTPAAVHAVLEHNDVVATVFARLLLWTLPRALPGISEPERAWEQYIDGWRPGKPHRRTWNGYYARAWDLVDTGGAHADTGASATRAGGLPG